MRRNFKLLCGIPVLLLVVPYSTGFVAHQTQNGEFPISSAIYASIASAIVAALAAFRKPILPKSTLLLFCLLALRFVDAGVFRNAPRGMDQNPITMFGFGVVYCLALICLTGDFFILRWCSITCGMTTLIIVCSLNIWEWQNPGYFSTVAGRSAGWLENPNESGICICLMLGLLLTLQLPIWFNIGIAVISGVGVFLTLSRGGFLVYIVTFLIYCLTQARRGIKIIALMGALLLGTFYFITQILEFRTTTDEDQIRRQGLLTGESQWEIREDDRYDLLQQSIKGIIRNPVIGYGTGATYSGQFAPHNELVTVWLDNGLPGFLLFIAALGFLVGECYRAKFPHMVGCIPLILETGFSHNLLENKIYLFAWVTLAALAWHARKGKSTGSSVPAEWPPVANRSRTKTDSRTKNRVSLSLQ